MDNNGRVTSSNPLFWLISFNNNIVINKAFKMLGFIVLRNTRELKNIQALKMLYCSLFRSNLKFESIDMGSNSTDQLVNNVQYKFLKLIAFCLNLPISKDSISLVADSIYIQPWEVRCKLSDI